MTDHAGYTAQGNKETFVFDVDYFGFPGIHQMERMTNPLKKERRSAFAAFKKLISAAHVPGLKVDEIESITTGVDRNGQRVVIVQQGFGT